MKDAKRYSGVLAHVTMLWSEFGIGDLGQGAYEFVSLLEKAGQTLWQVLPLGPTGYGDSPYQTFSTYAGQTLIISPKELEKEELLEEEDFIDLPTWFEDKIDYGHVIFYKNKLFKKAFERFKKQILTNEVLNKEYNEFCKDNSYWLDSYALFIALKAKNKGVIWLDWEDDISYKSNNDYNVNDNYNTNDNYNANDNNNNLDADTIENIDFEKFLQFEFFKQWFKLKEYANSKGIKIVGDIPIFVAKDSADVWANQELFMLDKKGHPLEVAGVPPDYFSETGQLWGNPLYKWEELEKDNYKWWINRIKHQLKLCDFLRIDHFRGFDEYWAVPATEETAIKGQWKCGPGKKFLSILLEELKKDYEELPLWAEDLGIITKGVEELRDEFELPGMKVLQFAFDSDEKSIHLPHNYPINSICYTGTHDNNTTKGWFDKLDDKKKKKINIYTGQDGSNISQDFIKLAISSTSKYVIIPIQDVLAIGSEGRMNSPGLAQSNWAFRIKKSNIKKAEIKCLHRLTKMYNR